ncbi:MULTISPECIES: peroxiredoxin family protein [unclassified Paenibacillus]|uniref:peroxiredoxin family protein n=1 Tax=unclassified Paenibacillus TaxID=185978 RepID=UPI0009556A71|nr:MULTISPECIES: peroxiredoxin family protein [unclassified Paenibacillus]ASS68283.1 AhpC/TSA family protein [Paenibacillus sp. RUD330]SIR27424.1 Peroxiredoxin [Paenibacillus sp. RU4X]SIR40022.1 Peroxiredoxin [Paenibacillus sp. RU4T]
MTTLTAGTPAPDFSLADWQGNPIRLADLQGRKVLLSFFRNAACALCNLRVQQLKKWYGEWSEQGLEIIAVFESPAASLREYVGKQDAAFPIVGDPEAELYRLYGVEVSEQKFKATVADPGTHAHIRQAAAAGFVLAEEEGANMHRIPADFLIDEQGIVQAAHYGSLVTDHLPLEAVARFAKTG